MKNIYFVVFLLYVVYVSCVKNITGISESMVVRAPDRMNTVTHKTIIKYYCSTDHISGINLILYGTNEWTFPLQDVNLTLRYPAADRDDLDDEKYWVTGFEVKLQIDGTNSRGFITSGGILQDSITLTFTSERISRLQYQFWVYGVRSDWEPPTELNNIIYDMCT